MAGRAGIFRFMAAVVGLSTVAGFALIAESWWRKIT
jgi:hypothetical protein